MSTGHLCSGIMSGSSHLSFNINAIVHVKWRSNEDRPALRSPGPIIPGPYSDKRCHGGPCIYIYGPRESSFQKLEKKKKKNGVLSLELPAADPGPRVMTSSAFVA